MTSDDDVLRGLVGRRSGSPLSWCPFGSREHRVARRLFARGLLRVACRQPLIYVLTRRGLAVARWLREDAAA